MTLPRHLILIPSLACQASCHYCFGPQRGSMMSHDIFDATLDWLEMTTPPGQKIDLTFHGGEPLLVGLAWYQRNLPRLRQRFGRRLKLHLQSNLWLLDSAYSDLFNEYGMSLGTSLDGPAPLTDAQRGKGYFARTMAGIETARRHGLAVGVICTFTRLSAPHYQEIFDFFAREYLPFSVHAAVSALKNSPPAELPLSPHEHADLLIYLFDYYLANLTRMRISTFDSICRSLATGQSGLCTFNDCLGNYLTIEPHGGIYSCNRLAHHPTWQLADVRAMPTLDSLAKTPIWQQWRQRELTIQQACGDCSHFNYCKGGCPYNVLASQNLKELPNQKDPHCPAYKRLFDHLAERAMAEVFAEQNLASIINEGTSQNGLLHHGKLLTLMRGGTHPQEEMRQAREIVAAVALAVSDSVETALQSLERANMVTNTVQARQSLLNLQNRQSIVRQENCYLHVTYNCQLRCQHCYAQAGPGQADSMPVDKVISLIEQAAQAGFVKVIITGGEPLAHLQRDALLDALADIRQTVSPMKIVLRTNLVADVTPALLKKLTHCADQIVVSIDGDEATHDTRRGQGTYAQTVAQLRLLRASLVADTLLIHATLTAAEIHGRAGQDVQTLGKQLGIEVRFKPLLPLGRATKLPLAPEFYIPLTDHAPALDSGWRTTCGLGMNLYISPRGECYPCYALMNKPHYLGNVLNSELQTILGSAQYRAWQKVTVDSNLPCRQCAWRYLCGGFCRAWSGEAETPPDCTTLRQRAQNLLLEALRILAVSPEQWRGTGLPL